MPLPWGRPVRLLRDDFRAQYTLNHTHAGAVFALPQTRLDEIGSCLQSHKDIAKGDVTRAQQGGLLGRTRSHASLAGSEADRLDDAGHAGHRRAVMRLPLCAIMCWIAPCGSLTGKNSTGYCCRIVAFQQRRHVVDECIVSIISPKPIATPGSVSIRCSAASKNQLHAGCTEPSKRRERRDSPSNQRADVSIRRLTCKRPKPAISHPTVAPISQPIAA